MGEVKTICRNCNALKFTTDSITGEITCSRCGCVFSEVSEDRGKVRRNLSGIVDNTRTGPGISLKRHDKGLSTIIGVQNLDSVGKSLSSNTIQTFARLRKWDSRSQKTKSGDRGLILALQELDKAQSKLMLSDTVIERASLFYRKASEKGLIRGRSVMSMAGACLYASCRDLEHNRTMSEITEQFSVQRKEVARAYRTLFRELDFTVSIADPIKSITKIASKIGLRERTTRRAIKILDVAQDAGIVAGKNPEIIAATAIYAACVITGESISQITISEAAGISTVSIRTRILEFRTRLSMFSTMI
jgi:transcription initiation factor TFIIB